MQQGKAAPTAVMNLVNEEPHHVLSDCQIVFWVVTAVSCLRRTTCHCTNTLPECEPNGESCPSSLVPCSLLWFWWPVLWFLCTLRSKKLRQEQNVSKWPEFFATCTQMTITYFNCPPQWWWHSLSQGEIVAAAAVAVSAPDPQALWQWYGSGKMFDGAACHVMRQNSTRILLLQQMEAAYSALVASSCQVYIVLHRYI